MFTDMSTLPLVFVLVLFLVPRLLEWVWNMTCPELFGLPSLTYWQAFRLIVIAGLLFGVWRAL